MDAIAIHSYLYYKVFYSFSPPLEQKWLETSFESSQDYAQEPQRNRTFMNLAFVLYGHKINNE